jgi:hypothetical protein
MALAAFARVPMKGLFDETPETRSAEEYEHEVEDYLTRLRDAWPAAVRELAAYMLPAPAFHVTNLSSNNYRQLEV